MYCTDEAQGTRQKCSVSESSAEQDCWFSREGEAESEQRIETERGTEQCDPSLSIFQMYRRGPERFGDIQTSEVLVYEAGFKSLRK